jgi:hypothetical protein
MAQQPLLGQGLLITESSRHSVRFLWTSDHPDAKTYVWQHKTHQKQACMPRQDSDPQTQEACGRNPRLRLRGYRDRHAYSYTCLFNFMLPAYRQILAHLTAPSTRMRSPCVSKSRKPTVKEMKNIVVWSCGNINVRHSSWSNPSQLVSGNKLFSGVTVRVYSQMLCGLCFHWLTL